MKSYKRLYIFTGKGGVGKTTNALAFTKLLQTHGKKVKIVFFQNSKLDPNAIKYNEVKGMAQEAELDYISLELLESCQNYIGMKLKSQTIANWVIKTPFFKSLINMIPGFNYLIYMGQILQLLKDDPELIIVLDSPSSGHALTMFEATKNFNQIFASGLLYNDTQLMLNMLRSPNFLKVNILTLPTTLAINEAKELTGALKKIDNFDIEIICNNTLEHFQDKNLPDFLKAKVANEVKAMKKNEEILHGQIPFSLAGSTKERLKDLVPSMENLV